MVLIRLAHAAHLPAPEDAARRLAELSETVAAARVPLPALSGQWRRAERTFPISRLSAARAPENMPRPQPSGPTATMLRAVPNPDPQPLQAGRIEMKPAEAPKPLVPVNSIADIVNLAAEKRDLKLKALVRNFVRPVKIEPGRLDVNLTEGAPTTLLNELAVKLKEWTGIHWIVSLSREAGEPTLVEAEAKAQEQQRQRRPPGSGCGGDPRPVSGRQDHRRAGEGAEPEEEGEAKPPAAAESEEGDILPGDDIEF